jgi:glyoxylase I family protein
MKIQKMHHVAYRCRDAEETRHFYEDLLGLPLVHVIHLEKVPSTGELAPCAHLFFGMADGSSIAFFDLGDGKASVPDPTTPSWLNHLAVEVESMDELLACKKRLQAEGVEVIGPTDHEFVESIYFFDPNGIRLEITTRTAAEAELAEYAADAHARLEAWVNRDKTQPARQAQAARSH